MKSSQSFSKLTMRLNETVRASFQEYRLFWIFSLLLWYEDVRSLPIFL
ncbi:sulfatase domain protein [Exiguobacterium sp. S17]|nr:sulfatase domain protein [Exiguobacterium sp. S17]